VGVGRLDAVTETRRITFEGSGPFVRTLVQALEDEGVTVAVRREGHSVDQRPTPRGMGDAVKATLVATGASEAIAAGVSTFRQRFANRAAVTIENEAAAPPPSARSAPGLIPQRARRGAEPISVRGGVALPRLS
jgi:hypothetical protein